MSNIENFVIETNNRNKKLKSKLNSKINKLNTSNKIFYFACKYNKLNMVKYLFNKYKTNINAKK